MRICDLHTVNLDEDEVIKFVRTNGLLQTGDDFPNRGSFTCSRSSRDVDTVACAIRNGGFEV
jgi:hypothetical protein